MTAQKPVYSTRSTTTMAMTTTVDPQAPMAMTATTDPTKDTAKTAKDTKRRHKPHPGRTERYRRQVRRLQAENDLLHARLAMIYDALTMSADDLEKERP